MFRVGIVKKSGAITSKNCKTKKLAEDFVLDIAEKEGIKYYKILDKETGKIVEKGEGI